MEMLDKGGKRIEELMYENLTKEEFVNSTLPDHKIDFVDFTVSRKHEKLSDVTYQYQTVIHGASTRYLRGSSNVNVTLSKRGDGAFAKQPIEEYECQDERKYILNRALNSLGNPHNVNRYGILDFITLLETHGFEGGRIEHVEYRNITPEEFEKSTLPVEKLSERSENTLKKLGLLPKSWYLREMNHGGKRYM